MNLRFHARLPHAGTLFLLLAIPLAGCAESTDEMPAGSYDAAGLEAMRDAKDSEFRGADSPIPAEIRGSFAGLAYFPPDPGFAVKVRLERFDQPEQVKVAATGGDVRMMTRVGVFRFDIDGTACSLAVYKSDPASAHLFVPFTDRTNGEETYEVGRYIDLEEQTADAPYLLDFNLCYNPYCAYNESYTCPIVPKENALPVEIRAGEKLPPFGAQ